MADVDLQEALARQGAGDALEEAALAAIDDGRDCIEVEVMGALRIAAMLRGQKLPEGMHESFTHLVRHEERGEQS